MKKHQVHSVLVAMLAAAGLCLSVSISAQAQTNARKNLVFVGQVRNDTGYLFRFPETGQNSSLGTASWDTCPQGTILWGHDKQSNGFWICVSPDIAVIGRPWYFGNVVKDRGYYYEVDNGNAKAIGQTTWDTCWEGRVRGKLKTSNGFWFCQP